MRGISSQRIHFAIHSSSEPIRTRIALHYTSLIAQPKCPGQIVVDAGPRSLQTAWCLTPVVRTNTSSFQTIVRTRHVKHRQSCGTVHHVNRASCGDNARLVQALPLPSLLSWWQQQQRSFALHKHCILHHLNCVFDSKLNAIIFTFYESAFAGANDKTAHKDTVQCCHCHQGDSE